MKIASTLLASINEMSYKATENTVVTHSSLYHQPGQMKLESLTLQDGHSRPVNFESFVQTIHLYHLIKENL